MKQLEQRMPGLLPAKLPSVDSQYFTEPRKLEDFCFCVERQHDTQADYPVAWRKAVCTPSSTCQAGPIGPYVTLVASWCNRGGGVFIKSTTEACTEYVAVQFN